MPNINVTQAIWSVRYTPAVMRVRRKEALSVIAYARGAARQHDDLDIMNSRNETTPASVQVADTAHACLTENVNNMRATSSLDGVSLSAIAPALGARC